MMPRSKEDYQWYKQNGICVLCKTQKADDGYCSCKKCRDKQREDQRKRREWLKQMRYCPQCGKEKLYGDEKICLECGVKKYESNLKSKKKIDNEYYKKRREEQKKKGICTRCNKRKSETGKTMCGICLARHRKESEERRGNKIPRYERASYGLCYICGEEIPDGKLCEKCKTRAMENLPKEKNKDNDAFRKMNVTYFMARKKAKT